MDDNNFSMSSNGERKNRFIFSDDYYEDMPLDGSNRLDVARKVQPAPGVILPNREPVISNNNVNNISLENIASGSVQQTSDFNNLVQNNYDNNDTNMFDFFGHNANVEENNDFNIDIPEEIKPEEEVNVVEENNSSSNTNKNFFSSFENPFSKKKNDDVVHIEKPVVEDSPFDIGRQIIIPDYEEINQEANKDEEVPFIENQPLAPPVETTGINEGLIDNIVDYQALIPPTVDEVNAEVGQFIVNNEPSIPVIEKKEEVPLTNFMGNTIRPDNFNIDSGINQELEEELIRKKELEEEELRKNNPELLDYLRYTPEEEKTEMLYRAGGKSIIREKQKKEPVIPVIVKPQVSEDIVEEPKIVNIDEELEKEPKTIQDMIENILDIPDLDEIVVPINPSVNPGVEFGTGKKMDEEVQADQTTIVYNEEEDNFDYDQNFENVEVIKSDLLDKLKEQAEQEGRISVLARYGEDFCSKDYITNPAIGRAEEIKQLILILLTPEKSGILIGKPGIGKTSIVEGLAYQLQRNNVPDALKGYRIVSVKTASLLGTLPTGETRLQTLVDELKQLDKIILFIDEIHMLIGATNDSSLDFANMFKESLGRGSIKVIGATTTEEYERYILRDKAFVRRFQKVEVEEPDRTHTIKILMGTLPKIEKNTGAKLKYTEFIKSEIMAFIVDITTEYKRIYGIGSRYPDICLTLLAQAFSQAVFANRKEVTIIDIRRAIENSKNIYPDVIKKELINFDIKFKDIIREEEMGK